MVQPPWNANVKTNLGRNFLNIIERCCSNGHPLHKIFNKHTLQLSYSCMPNRKSIILSRNKPLLQDYQWSQTETSNKDCNCGKKIKAHSTENASHKTQFTTQQSQRKLHQNHVSIATDQIITVTTQHPFDIKAR